MNLLESFRVALEAVLANKGRSFLTMLGVTVGVAAVILLVSFGEGLRSDVGSELRGLGSNLIILHAGKEETRGGGGPGQRRMKPSKPIQLTDLRILKEHCPAIADGTAEIARPSEAKRGSRSRDLQVEGVGANYDKVRDLHAQIGSFIRAEHVESGQRVAVIGVTVRKELFPGESALGGTLRVGGARFRVIGILEAKGSSMGNDEDNRIIIPVTAAQQLFATDDVDMLFLTATSEDEIGAAKNQITRIMKARHRGEEDFTVVDQADILKIVNKVLGIATAAVGGIGGISLFVGGIGIMNIMLVSVTERIREIGVRKAIGAREGDILRQFLIEATTLSVMGGAIGIGLGWVGSTILKAVWKQLPTHVSLLAVAIAFAFSAAVGIFSGAYPAYRASKLDPIVALRHE